jgi:acyl dehydratase
MPYFEDLKVGQHSALGSFTFSAELIKRFAHQFDPQPFHLDEEEGRRSLFGGLAASGWHIASVGMKLLVAKWRRETDETAALDGADPMPGPSPGFCDLKWRKPVLSGDTLSYSYEIVALRDSVSKPEWGIAQARTSTTNQRGELVFSVLVRAALSLQIVKAFVKILRDKCRADNFRERFRHATLYEPVVVVTRQTCEQGMPCQTAPD